MSEQNAISTSGSEPTHPEAVARDSGFWVDKNDDCLPVSASDLERFTYCPMSWYLSATGHSGQSESIKAGIQRHKAIHEGISNFEKSRLLTMKPDHLAMVVCCRGCFVGGHLGIHEHQRCKF